MDEAGACGGATSTIGQGTGRVTESLPWACLLHKGCCGRPQLRTGPAAMAWCAEALVNSDIVTSWLLSFSLLLGVGAPYLSRWKRRYRRRHCKHLQKATLLQAFEVPTHNLHRVPQLVHKQSKCEEVLAKEALWEVRGGYKAGYTAPIYRVDCL